MSCRFLRSYSGLALWDFAIAQIDINPKTQEDYMHISRILSLYRDLFSGTLPNEFQIPWSVWFLPLQLSRLGFPFWYSHLGVTFSMRKDYYVPFLCVPVLGSGTLVIYFSYAEIVTSYISSLLFMEYNSGFTYSAIPRAMSLSTRPWHIPQSTVLVADSVWTLPLQSCSYASPVWSFILPRPFL